MWTALPLLLGLTHAEPVTVDGHPIHLELTAPWSAAVRGKRSLTLANNQAHTELAIDWVPGLQRDFSTVDPTAFAAALASEDLPSHITFGPFSGERVDHPTLGPVIVVRADGTVDGSPRPVRMRFATFAGPAGTLSVAGGIYQPVDRADALFAEALDQMAWKREPFGHRDFETGAITVDDYALELPEGWRRLHPEERDNLDTHRDSALFLKVGSDPLDVFACVVNDQPLDVVDPSRADLFANNFRHRTRALLTGRSFVSRSGSQRTRTDVTLAGTPVRVAPDADGTLEWIPLGDRHGYRWTVPGTLDDSPVEVHTVYTTWGRSSVDCTWIAPPDHPATDAVDQALRSLHIVDGEAHPQPLSAHATYVSVWPFTHPLLQVWVFGGVLLLGAVGGLLRALR